MKKPAGFVVFDLPTPYLTNLTILTSLHMEKSEVGEVVEPQALLPHITVDAVRPRRTDRVDDQDAEDMADFVDCIRFALFHHPELSDAEHGAEIGRQLNLDPEDVRGRVTAIRQRLVGERA